MKFRINVMKYQDGSDDLISVNEAPIEGAYCEEQTYQQSENATRIVPYIEAELDVEGKPFIAHKTRVETVPIPTWFKNGGTNHRRDGDRWVRDVICKEWFIDIDDLTQLLNLLHQPRSRGYIDVDDVNDVDSPSLTMHL